MTVQEFRDKTKDISRLPKCSKIYIDIDRNYISLGTQKEYGDMRMKRSEESMRYYTLKDLLNGNQAYIISDGNFVMSMHIFQSRVSKGKTIPLMISIDNFMIILSDYIQDQFEAQGVNFDE